MLQKQMDGLAFSGGYAAAWDDVTNAELVPDLVKKDREVEMGYIAKLGVYEYVSKVHQLQTDGKIIGVRWVPDEACRVGVCSGQQRRIVCGTSVIESPEDYHQPRSDIHGQWTPAHDHDQ